MLIIFVFSWLICLCSFLNIDGDLHSFLSNRKKKILFQENSKAFLRTHSPSFHSELNAKSRELHLQISDGGQSSEGGCSADRRRPALLGGSYSSPDQGLAAGRVGDSAEGLALPTKPLQVFPRECLVESPFQLLLLLLSH